MTFSEFCELCQELEATRSRLAKIAATARFLQNLSADEVPSAVAFLGDGLKPDFRFDG